MVAERQDSGEPAPPITAYVDDRLAARRRDGLIEAAMRTAARRLHDRERKAAERARGQQRRVVAGEDTLNPAERQVGTMVRDCVALYYRVTPATLIAPGKGPGSRGARNPLLVEARMVAAALLRDMGIGPTSSGRILRRDHSSVLNALSHWPAANGDARAAFSDVRAQIQALGQLGVREPAPTTEGQQVATAARAQEHESIKRGKHLVGCVAAACSLKVGPLLTDLHPAVESVRRVCAVLLHDVGLSGDGAAAVLQCPTTTLLARWVGLGLVGAGTTGYGRQPLTGDERRMLLACAGRARQRGLLSEEAAARVAGAGMPQGRRA